MRSSYRKGKYPRRSSNVRRPRWARISARRGPTPFRYISSVAGVTDIHCLYHRTPMRGMAVLRDRTERLSITCRMGKDELFVPAPREACLPLERLDRKDAKVLLIWILAGILGAAVAYAYFFRAFPEASVEFKVPRADARAPARQS